MGAFIIARSTFVCPGKEMKSVGDNFITFDMLQNFATLATVLVILTQFTKDLVDKVVKFPTRYLVFIYAEIILFLNLARTGTWSIEAVVTTIINGIFVTLAAMKAFESTVEPIMTKLQNNKS